MHDALMDPISDLLGGDDSLVVSFLFDVGGCDGFCALEYTY